MAGSLSPVPCTQDSVLGDLQQLDPPAPGAHGAELARGRHPEPGDGYAGRHADIAATPVRGGGNRPPEARRQRRGARRIRAGELEPAETGHIRQRNDERANGPRRTPWCEPVELGDGAALNQYASAMPPTQEEYNYAA